MEETTLDKIVYAGGSIVTILTACTLFLTSFTFSKKDFQAIRIYKFISFNSAIDGSFFILATVSQTISYLETIELDENWSFLLKFLTLYLILCLGAILKTLSEYISISVAFYRLIELSRFRMLNRRTNFKIVIVCLLILSLLTTWPIFIMNKIELINKNGSIYEIQPNKVLLNGHNVTQITIYIRFLLSFINLLLLLLPNIYFIFILVTLYRKRSALKKLNASKAQRLISQNNNVNRTRCVRLLKITKREICVSLLVGSISIVFILDFALKYFFYFLMLRYSAYSLNIKKYRNFVHNMCYCLIYLINFCCYYFISPEFKRNFKNIFEY